MPAKRFIIDTPNGPVLVEQPAGVSVLPFQGSEPIELSGDNKAWSDMQKKLKTGKLDFATVKKEHGIIEEQSN